VDLAIYCAYNNNTTKCLTWGIVATQNLHTEVNK
jgi:hypothetical protein